MRDNTPVGKRWPLNLATTALLLVAGIAQAISLAWPFEGSFRGASQGWLQCVSLAVLAGLLDRSHSIKQAFVIGWLFSLAWSMEKLVVLQKYYFLCVKNFRCHLF